jgi:hypothetical protein
VGIGTEGEIAVFIECVRIKLDHPEPPLKHAILNIECLQFLPISLLKSDYPVLRDTVIH